MAHIGSAEDKAARKAAAETEEAWVGAGAEEGVQVSSKSRCGFGGKSRNLPVPALLVAAYAWIHVRWPAVCHSSYKYSRLLAPKPTPFIF